MREQVTERLQLREKEKIEAYEKAQNERLEEEQRKREMEQRLEKSRKEAEEKKRQAEIKKQKMEEQKKMEMIAQQQKLEEERRLEEIKKKEIEENEKKLRDEQKKAEMIAEEKWLEEERKREKLKQKETEEKEKRVLEQKKFELTLINKTLEEDKMSKKTIQNEKETASQTAAEIKKTEDQSRKLNKLQKSKDIEKQDKKQVKNIDIKKDTSQALTEEQQSKIIKGETSVYLLSMNQKAELQGKQEPNKELKASVSPDSLSPTIKKDIIENNVVADVNHNLAESAIDANHSCINNETNNAREIPKMVLDDGSSLRQVPKMVPDDINDKQMQPSANISKYLQQELNVQLNENVSNSKNNESAHKMDDSSKAIASDKPIVASTETSLQNASSADTATPISIVSLEELQPFGNSSDNKLFNEEPTITTTVTGSSSDSEKSGSIQLTNSNLMSKTVTVEQTMANMVQPSIVNTYESDLANWGDFLPRTVEERRWAWMKRCTSWR